MQVTNDRANTKRVKVIPVGIGIIGTGAVGSALARALSRAGYKLTALLDQNTAAARKLAKELNLQQYASSLRQIGRETQLLIIAVPDSHIPDIDRSIAKVIGPEKPEACVHTSGALPGSVLQAVSECGIPVGSIHPLQTFSSRKENIPLRGVYFAVEGDPSVLELLGDIVVQLGGIPVNLPSDGKAIYHAAAVFASNFLPGILRSSLELLASIGISPSQGRTMLAPLMRQSLENCLRIGEVEALTGPVARGDAQTVKRHLEAIGASNPAYASLYRILSLMALELADEKGLDEDDFKSVYQVLSA